MKKLFKALALSLSVFMMMSVGIAQVANSKGPEIVKKEAGGTGLNGWASDFNHGATGSVTTGNMIVIDVTNSGTLDWHAKFCKYDNSVTGGNRYSLTFVMYSTKAIKANYIVNNEAAGWSPYAGTWDMSISTSKASYTLNFAPSASSSNVDFLFQFGGAWAENAAPFTIYIEKILLETQTPTVAFSDDFTSGTEGWTNVFRDGAIGTITNPSSNLVQNITDYGAEDVWDVQLYKGTGINLTSGSWYRLDMDVNVGASQIFEACFQDSGTDDSHRAGFNNGTWTTSTTNYSYLFQASMNITGLFLKFQLGQAGTSNTITIDNVKFYSYPSTYDETRPGYYASEFATVLGGYDTCVASAETGYLAAPTLKVNYYDKLIDAYNLSTTYVTDYAYNLGEGTGPKTANAVTADVKWVAMVMMYNANNGGDPDLSLAGVAPTVEETSLFAATDLSTIIIIFVLGFNAIALYYLASKRKPSHQ